MSKCAIKDVVGVISKDPTLEGYYVIIAYYENLVHVSIRLQRLSNIAPEIKWEYHVGSFSLHISGHDYTVESYSIIGHDTGETEMVLELKK